MTPVCAEVAKLPMLEGLKGPITTVTSSMGVAGFPRTPRTSGLRAAADAALYRAKEEGRNRVVCAARRRRRGRSLSMPDAEETRHRGASGEKNQIIERSSRPSPTRRRFLVLGHQSPGRRLHLLHDLLRPGAAHVLQGRVPAPAASSTSTSRYLLDICRYNSIPIARRRPGPAGGHRHGRALRHAEALHDGGEPGGAGAHLQSPERAAHRDRPPPRRRTAATSATRATGSSRRPPRRAS